MFGQETVAILQVALAQLNYKTNKSSDMKNTIISRGLIFTVLVITSITTYYGCKKDTPDLNDTQNVSSAIADFIFKSSQPTDGNISFITQDQTFARIRNSGGVPYLNFSAGFYKNKEVTNYISINKLIIDGKEISSNGKAYSFLEFGIHNDTARWLNSLWGRTININADNTNTNSTAGTGSNGSSGSISNVNGQLYIPATIQINSSSPENNVTFLRKTGQAINWNPDPNNPSKKTIIVVVYDAYTSRLSYPSMPNKDKIVLQKEVDDNGSYTLTGDDLKDLLLNSSAYIEIGRGNYLTIKDKSDSTKNVFVTALTTSKQPVTVSN